MESLYVHVLVTFIINGINRNILFACSVYCHRSIYSFRVIPWFRFTATQFYSLLAAVAMIHFVIVEVIKRTREILSMGLPMRRLVKHKRDSMEET